MGGGVWQWWVCKMPCIADADSYTQLRVAARALVWPFWAPARCDQSSLQSEEARGSTLAGCFKQQASTCKTKTRVGSLAASVHRRRSRGKPGSPLLSGPLLHVPPLVPLAWVLKSQQQERPAVGAHTCLTVCDARGAAVDRVDPFDRVHHSLSTQAHALRQRRAARCCAGWSLPLAALASLPFAASRHR